MKDLSPRVNKNAKDRKSDKKGKELFQKNKINVKNRIVKYR